MDDDQPAEFIASGFHRSPLGLVYSSRRLLTAMPTNLMRRAAFQLEALGANEKSAAALPLRPGLQG
jgi:hypothetical protein